MLDIKNTVTEMKTDFYGLISRQDMVIKRISELKYIPIEYLRTRKEREQRWKKKSPKQNRISKDKRRTTKGITYM